MVLDRIMGKLYTNIGKVLRIVLASCPHHQISERLLIQYFYECLLPIDKSMIDVATGGALLDKTLAAVRDLIANIA